MRFIRYWKNKTTYTSLRKIRYSFHRTFITGIHFHSSFYSKNLLLCLYRLFTSNTDTIRQFRENSFIVFAFKTYRCGNFYTETFDSRTCCITCIFHRIGYYRRKNNATLLKFTNFRRQFSKITILNSSSIDTYTNFINLEDDNTKIPNIIQDNFHSEDIEKEFKMAEEFSSKEKILRNVERRLFNERVKKKLRNESLHYNMLTQDLHQSRNDPLKAYEIYAKVVKNGLLNYIKSHHIRMILQIIYYHPNKTTFKWLIQIMKDFHSFNLKYRIPFDVYKMALYKMVDLSNNDNSLSDILDAIAEKNAFYGRVDAYCILIRMYCERGDVKEGLYILRRVILFGQIPRKGLYSALIHELCKQGKLEIAEELLKEFEEYLDTPDISLFTSMISGYSKKGEIIKIEEILKKLFELGIQPDRELYTTLIFAYLRHGNIHSAYEIYQEIIVRNIEHDIYLFVSQIYMRAINSDSANARKIFERMNSTGIMPNTEAYNHLIYAYSRDDSIKTSKIENLYLLMQAQGVEPNHYTYELLIDAMCKRRNFLKASRFFIEMKRNFTITNVALNSIIRHQTLSEYRDNAVKLYNQMISVGIEPDLYIYTTIISLATVSSRHLFAIKIFKELLKKGHKPNVYVYSALITSLIKAKKPQMAIQIFQHMVNDNITLNHIPFTALIQGFVMTKRYEDGKKLYEMMKKMNLKIDRFVFYHFEKLIEQSKDVEYLKYLREDLRKYGLDPKSRDRIYNKGKGPSYWRLKRRILRLSHNSNENRSIRKKKKYLMHALWKKML